MRTILPRKVTINGTTETFELFLYKRAVAGFKVSKTAKFTWVDDALTPRAQTILYEFLISVRDALENGTLSISLLSDDEKAALMDAMALRAAPTEKDEAVTATPEVAPEVAAPVETVTTQQDLIVSDFFNEIKEVSIFSHFRDSANGDARSAGVTLSSDGSICDAMKADISGWERLVGPSLADGPKMIVASGPSGQGSVLVCAVQDTQYLVAEINMHKLGSVIALWNKATQKV